MKLKSAEQILNEANKLVVKAQESIEKNNYANSNNKRIRGRARLLLKTA